MVGKNGLFNFAHGGGGLFEINQIKTNLGNQKKYDIYIYIIFIYIYMIYIYISYISTGHPECVQF